MTPPVSPGSEAPKQAVGETTGKMKSMLDGFSANGMKLPQCEPKAKGKAKRKAKGKTKAKAAKPSIVAKTGQKRKNYFDNLNFRPTGWTGGIFYGTVTLYYDRIREIWRVKHGPGRRDNIKIKAGNKAKLSELVALVKELPQKPDSC